MTRLSVQVVRGDLTASVSMRLSHATQGKPRRRAGHGAASLRDWRLQVARLYCTLTCTLYCTLYRWRGWRGG